MECWSLIETYERKGQKFRRFRSIWYSRGEKDLICGPGDFQVDLARQELLCVLPRDPVDIVCTYFSWAHKVPIGALASLDDAVELSFFFLPSEKSDQL
jgi:hypothetical protein